MAARELAEDGGGPHVILPQGQVLVWRVLVTRLEGDVSAYEQLMAGAIGDETIDLPRRLCAQYTRTHSFPPPGGYDRWLDDALDDLLASIRSLMRATGSALVQTRGRWPPVDEHTWSQDLES